LTFTNFRHFKAGAALHTFCKLSSPELTYKSPAPKDLRYSIVCTGCSQRIPRQENQVPQRTVKNPLGEQSLLQRPPQMFTQLNSK